MNTTYVVANWKSNKTTTEAKQWLYVFSQTYKNRDDAAVIVCVPFTILSYVHAYSEANDLPIKVGAQSISSFDMGAYTGAVSAKQVVEFASYVIIGHSERRQYFHENDEELAQQVAKALEHKLTPIFCIQGKDTPIPDGVSIVAYEPISAIGTGHPESPENARRVANSVKAQHSSVQTVLYGGSVTEHDVATFTKANEITGVLVGGASLDALKFCQLIANA